MGGGIWELKQESSTVLHLSMEGTGVSAIRNQGVYILRAELVLDLFTPKLERTGEGCDAAEST